MNNKFRLLFLTVLAVITQSVLAQKSTRYWELGFFMGTLNSSSDITTENDIGNMLAETRARGGIFFKYNFNPVFGMGMEAAYGSVHAEDGNHGLDRGYVMNTSIGELNLIANVNFKKFGKFFRRRQNTPYLKLGLGAVFYDPKLDINKYYPPEYTLYPNAYQGVSYTIGLGWKWRLSYQWIYSMEIAYSALSIDNLEGFTYPQPSKNNDGIFGLRMAFSYGIFE